MKKSAPGKDEQSAPGREAHGQVYARATLPISPDYQPIEDYALIGDLPGVALVGRKAHQGA